LSTDNVRRLAATAVAAERMFATQTMRRQKRFLREPLPIRMFDHLIQFTPMQQAVFRMIAYPNVTRWINNEKTNGSTASSSDLQVFILRKINNAMR
jgi:hypothetical protein